MTVSRTDDLHFASWLAGWQDPQCARIRFAQYRRIPGDDASGRPAETLTALVGCLRAATAPYLCVEVTYGEWTGRPGFWGEPAGTAVPPIDEGGRLTRMSLWAADKGVRIAAFGARQRALRRQWWDGLLHTPLTFQGRDYALFRGPLEAVTQWESTLGRLAFRHSPDLIWPDDHSWLVVAAPDGALEVWGDDRLGAALDAEPLLDAAPR